MEAKNIRRNKCSKNLFDDDVDDDEGKKGNQRKWFSILMYGLRCCLFTFIMPSWTGYIENMCFNLKHHPRTGFVLLVILNFFWCDYIKVLCVLTLCILSLFEVVSVLVFHFLKKDKWIFFLMFSFYAGSSFSLKRRQNKGRVWSEQIHQADWKMKELGQSSTYESDWFCSIEFTGN